MPNSTVEVIAELAATHDGQYRQGVEAIREVACFGGANAVKFQWTSSAEAMARSRQLMPQNYALLQFPLEYLGGWADVARAYGLDFMCTVYLPEDILLVAPLVKAFKVASLEACWKDFLDAHLVYGKPLYISTGATNWFELEELLEYRYTYPQVRLLQCTSIYPANSDEVDLEAIRFHHLDGYSDHTRCLIAGACAVMAGATIVEVHARGFDTQATNPDYAHSFDPVELGAYIRNVRQAEMLKGDERKTIHPREVPLRAHRGGQPS